jgi:MFS family permease
MTVSGSLDHVLTPYLRILRMPGARGFVVSGLLARLPMSMFGIGTILLVQRSSGSYTLAGAVAAAGQVASAVVSPALGRQTDRRGQSAVLPWQLAVHCIGLTALILVAEADAPRWTLFVSVIVGGVGYPAIGSLVRARWSHLLRGDPRLETAFALEATLDEVVFVIGPVLVTVLALGVHPAAGLGSAVGLTAIGGLWFLSHRDTQPPGSGLTGRSSSVVGLYGVPILISTGFALATAFAALEVTVVGFADAKGHQVMAGPVLACFSFGSLLAGVYCGSHTFRWSMVARLRRGVGILALASLPLLVVPNLLTLAVMGLLLGLTIAPSLIALMGMTERLVPAEMLTEGFALVSTAIAFGLAIGSMIGGRAVDGLHGSLMFVVTVGGFLVAAAVASQAVDRAPGTAGPTSNQPGGRSHAPLA